MCVLSVIIPVYNASGTIQQCIESVVSEAALSGLCYEVILVDDGSSDNSLMICQEIARNNPCVKVLSQENAGPSAARNAGLKIAQGEYIALNDADDKWLPGKLKIQIDELKKHPDVHLVCATYGFHLRAEKRTVITYKKEVFLNFFSPQTSVFRSKSLVGGFPENQNFSEDMRFLLDFMKTGQCVYLPFVATVPVIKKCVFGESGLSAHLWSMEKGELKNIVYAHKIKKISLAVMLLACTWSVAKFFRRVAVSGMIKKRR